MDRRRFQTPIVLYAGIPAQFHLISTIGDASDFLFDHWADNDTPQWLDAMNRCAWANLGKGTLEAASSAFIVAVKSAGMSIDPEISLY